MFRTAFFYVIACKLGFWQKLICQAPLGSNFGASSLNWLELAQLAWSVCPQTADLSFCHTIQGQFIMYVPILGRSKKKVLALCALGYSHTELYSPKHEIAFNFISSHSLGNFLYLSLFSRTYSKLVYTKLFPSLIQNKPFLILCFCVTCK